jgi:transcription elongation factor GreA
VYSEKSPLGSAVLDRKAGDDAAYELPNGRKMQVTVVKVERFSG